jgi:hypothetical protein
MGTGKLTFGIMSTGFPFWIWLLGRYGECKWIYLQGDLQREEWLWMARYKCLTSGSLTSLPEVEVLLFDGPKGPHSTHEVWSTFYVNIIVWIGRPTHSRSNVELNRLWDFQSHVFQHQALGGVTDGNFRLFAAVRRSLHLGSLFGTAETSSVPGFLHHILNPLVTGRRVRADLPLPALPHGEVILPWRQRFGDILAPTVYSKTRLIQRPLTESEMLKVLDVPASVCQDLSPVLATHWKRSLTVPCKIRVVALDCIEQLLAPRTSAPDEVSRGDLLPHHTPEENPSTNFFSPVAGPSDDDSVQSDADTVIQGNLNSLEGDAKAAKADNATIPVSLWNSFLRSRVPSFESIPADRFKSALDVLRSFLLRWWKRRVTASFASWWKKHNTACQLTGDLPSLSAYNAGCVAVSYAAEASWWTWDAGSAVFFWNWRPEFQMDAALGIPPRFMDAPPHCTLRQRAPRVQAIRSQEAAKLAKVVKQGYIVLPSSGQLLSLTHFFSVPKTIFDIRMVYDATKSGLNFALWSPWFALDTVDAVIRSMEGGTWSVDNDQADMFLNFWLHEDLRPYVGVDFSQHRSLMASHFDSDFEIMKVGLWSRPAMGITSSPYDAVQGGLRIKRSILGDRHLASNPFRWATVDANLPGAYPYAPGRSWMTKRRADGSLASDIHSYVDNGRETGATYDDAWLASTRVGKVNAHLGCQDAARKRRAPAQVPGAWAGASMSTDDTDVYKSVTQERWEKLKTRLSWISEHYDGSRWGFAQRPLLEHAELERIRGFLVYVTRTYKALTPYLKGVHLTLDSWRGNRNDDGWRLATPLSDIGHPLGLCAEPVLEDAPPKVKAVPRLQKDIQTFLKFTASAIPPQVRARPVALAVGVFGFGDASGAGFGVSAWFDEDPELDVEYGLWTDETSNQSSNFRELLNLVLYIERLIKEGRITEATELFLFTDNFVSERCFYNGSSKSRTLHELIERIRALEMVGAIFVHLVWVAGTRMISQGTDGLSRGDLSNGVLGGEHMLKHVPLNETVLDRCFEAVEWLQSSVVGGDWRVLEFDDWFDRVHTTDGSFFWFPPPAVADVAVEQLCESKHIRPWNTHVFACPALMTARWRKQLMKVADVVFVVPVGCDVWPSNMHEPLVVGLICPLLSSSPWQIKESFLPDRLKTALPKVWSPGGTTEGNSVREFWESTRSWDARVQRCLARSVLPADVGRLFSRPGAFGPGRRFAGSV